MGLLNIKLGNPIFLGINEFFRANLRVRERKDER